MITDILEGLKISASNDDIDSRRSHERREIDSCIAIIDSMSYPVENWSQGGILLHGDDRAFGINEVKEITIKFKVADKIMNVSHNGRVLRKGNGKFALQFAPLTQQVDKQFQHVLDDFMAQEFANSQR